MEAGSEELENIPTTNIDGTAYDAKTGTWVEAAGKMTSNEVDATVTYTGDFSSIGVETGGVANPNVSLNIDASGWNNVAINHGGLTVGAYTTHTVVIKVIAGTVNIDKFMAV